MMPRNLPGAFSRRKKMIGGWVDQSEAVLILQIVRQQPRAQAHVLLPVGVRARPKLASRGCAFPLGAISSGRSQCVLQSCS